jgi:hypothetical protein
LFSATYGFAQKVGSAQKLRALHKKSKAANFSQRRAKRISKGVRCD